MLRSYRSIFFAAFGIAVASASSAQPIEQNASGQTSTSDPDQRPSENTVIAEAASRIARALEAQVNDPEAKEDRERAKEDLTAQKDMAKWTLVMALVSVCALVLSAFGVYLIYVTFRQTRVASRYAGIGARHSRKALAHMRRVSESELRPYLFIERVELTDIKRWDTPANAEAADSEDGTGGGGDGDIVKGALYATVVMHFRNFGKIPARNIRVYDKSYLARLSAGQFWRYSLKIIDLWVCAPGHERRTFGALFIQPDEREWFDAGVIEFILRPRFTFEDDRGNRFEERASFRVSGDKLDTFFLLPRVDVAKTRENYRQYQLDIAAAQKARKPRAKRPPQKKRPYRKKRGV